MSEESLRERELTKKGNFAKAAEVALDMPKQVIIDKPQSPALLVVIQCALSMPKETLQYLTD